MPQTLGLTNALATCRDLHSLPTSDRYILDFNETQHFEPFGMLIVGSAIRRLSDRQHEGENRPEIVIAGKSYAKQGHDYARRLGFWWSIGDDSDLQTVKQTASETTIPLTRLSYKELHEKAGCRDPIRAQLVLSAAGDLASILTGGKRGSEAWLALHYCFHEMIRNAFEHGGEDSVWYSAATRPSKDDVQIAILDSGRGIRESLANNPKHRHESDAKAIEAALRAGVSRNVGNKQRKKRNLEKQMEEFPGQPPGLFDNSGFGLTITSIMGRDEGQFAIASGNACVGFTGGSQFQTSTNHTGTAVRLILQPSKLDRAWDRAYAKALSQAENKSQKPLITASMMKRLGLSQTNEDPEAGA